VNDEISIAVFAAVSGAVKAMVAVAVSLL